MDAIEKLFKAYKKILHKFFGFFRNFFLVQPDFTKVGCS